MNATLTLLLDGLLVVLLTGTIASSLTLQKRLKALGDARKDFAAMVGQFDEASRRADAGVKALQAAAKQSGEGLQRETERAVRLRDELSFMLDSAENIARRLERPGSGSGSGAGAAAPPSPPLASSSSPATAPAASPPDPRSRAERDLLQALKSGGLTG